MNYAIYLLVSAAAVVLGLGLAAKLGLVTKAAAWAADNPRRKALLAMAGGFVLVMFDGVGLLFFDPQITGEEGSAGSLLGIGWLVMWMSVWVLATGSLKGPDLPSAIRVVILLAYLVTGIAGTIFVGGWAMRALRPPVVAASPPVDAAAQKAIDDARRLLEAIRAAPQPSPP